MTLDAARITVRLHRFELVALGLAIGLVSVVAVIVAAKLDGTGYGPECMHWDGEAIRPAGCIAAETAFWSMVSNEAGPVFAVLTILPLIGGLFLGVPIVARELERGTTRLAWSLTPSRWRWYLARLLPVLVALGALGFLAGVSADRLVAARSPDLDVANAFTDFGFRGVVLAARTVFVFGLAVAIGTIMGRALPAVIVTAIVAGIGIAGGSHVHEQILRSEAILRPDDGEYRSGDRYYDQLFKLPSGELVGWDRIHEIDPPPENTDHEWDPMSKYQMFSVVVPGERYRSVELREVGALGGGTLVALLVAGVVVQRRRPG